MKEKWKQLLKMLKAPRPCLIALTYILTAVCCSFAITFAVMGARHPVLEHLSYVLYALAAVTLGYAVYITVMYAPRIRGCIVRGIKKYAFGRRMLESYGFRTIIFAAVSLVINIAYVAFNAVIAIVNRSFWYGSLAIYYGLLIALRSGIVLYHRGKSRADVSDPHFGRRIEINKYRTCGIILTVIPFSLVVPILQIIFLDKAFEWQGTMVIGFAAYAFYKIILAIINVVKSRTEEDMTVQAVRNVGLADALVSIFSLQTALLHSFSEGSYNVANAMTGSAVCLLTVGIGIFMIFKAKQMTKELRIYDDGREEQH